MPIWLRESQRPKSGRLPEQRLARLCALSAIAFSTTTTPLPTATAAKTQATATAALTEAAATAAKSARGGL